MRRQTRKLTPPEVARRLGVSADKVLVWVHSGELRAVNLATKPHGRPRFAIDEADLDAFEEQRRVRAPAPVSRRRRKQRKEASIIEFF